MRLRNLFVYGILVLALIAFVGCTTNETADVIPVKEKVGHVEASNVVDLNENGRTSEQENVLRKNDEDNEVGAIKHLYVLSAYSGEVILYSTVDGKVTSSGKRLHPKEFSYIDYIGDDGNLPRFKDRHGNPRRTREYRGDDGTFGSSIEYLYWWDTKGVSHKHYVSGGQIVHITNEPMSFGNVTLTVDHTGSSN